MIDRGDIGEPLAANAFMLGSGPESWHPNPAIFYQHGAGPLFDMGPYYLTTLVQLLGPARARQRVGADLARAAARSRRSRCAASCIDVEVPTHVGALIEFASGPIATLVTSFDVQATRYCNIEVYGTEATLSVPNPNTFGGPVRIKRNGDEAWTEIELAARAPAAAARHRPRRHDLGAAHRSRRTGRRARSRCTCSS